MAVGEEIEGAGAAVAAAVNGKDGKAAAALYTANGALFPAGAARQDGTAAIAAFWQAAADAGLADVALRTVEVTDLGDHAIEVGVATGRMGDTALVGKYLVHWQRVGADWRLHRDIWCWDA